MPSSAPHLLQRLREDGIERIDLKLTDLTGRWHGFGLESQRFDEPSWQSGLLLEAPRQATGAAAGSGGLLRLRPDASSAWIDPFVSPRSLSLLCRFEPAAGAEARFRHCSRSLAVRALEHLAGSGVADRARFAATVEFFLLEPAAPAAPPAAGEGPEPVVGAVPGAPAVRNELLLSLAALGIRARSPDGPEADGPRQTLILGSGDPLRLADALMVSRYAADQVAQRHGLSACFLPRPGREPLCAGLAVAQSLWKAGHPLFGGEGTYGDLSQTARWYLGGLLRHGASLAAFTNPGTNSYRRLRGGCGAPTRLGYARHDASCTVIVPASAADPARRRLVLQQPDGLINPYLAFSALLQAGLDGIRRRLDPGPPCDRQESAAAGGQDGAAAEVAGLPTALGGALEALAGDHDYLLAGGVFSAELLEDWIASKRRELDELEQRPHPYEFSLEPSRCLRVAAAS